MKKEIREKVFAKYNGHCAYCGKDIAYNEMQVDHLIPQRLLGVEYDFDEIECFKNYMPSCRRCNHYKRGNSLETFRTMISEIPNKLHRDNYIYKVGEDFGIVKAHYNSKIEFYFEKCSKAPKFICAAARDCECAFWNYGKVCEYCFESDCLYLERTEEI